MMAHRGTTYIFHIYSILLYILIQFMVIPTSHGAEFYVSPRGDDNNSGTKEKPFATIEKARDTVRDIIAKGLQENVLVYIRDGVYRIDEAIRFDRRDSGSERFSIMYMAYPGERPVISGGYKIENWTAQKDGSWHTKIANRSAFRELFVNNKRAQRARYPNQGYLRVLQAGEDRMSQFIFNPGDIPKEATGTGMELVFFHDWSISRIPIREVDHEKHILYPAAKIGRQHFMMVIDGYEKHPRYYLENHAAFCDSAGEWYLYPSGTLIYRPRQQENIENVSAVAPLTKQILFVQGVDDKTIQNLHFKGLIFEHCAFSLPVEGYAGVQAAHYPEDSGDGMRTFVTPALQFQNTENCGLNDCTIRHIGGSGILFAQGCVDCYINNGTVSDICGNGIMVGENSSRQIDGQLWWHVAERQAAARNIIKNCLIEDCGIQFSGAVGIWVGLAQGTVISHNEIRNLPYTGVSIGWMWNPTPTPCKQNIVAYNHIQHVMQVLSDGGGIYTLGIQPGTVLHHNLIHDVTVNIGRAESNGMFLDEGTTNIVVEDNVIYQIGKSPLRFHKAGKNVVQNNILQISPNIPTIRYNNTEEVNIQKIGNTVIKHEVAQSQDLQRAIKELQQRMSSGT